VLADAGIFAVTPFDIQSISGPL